MLKRQLEAEVLSLKMALMDHDANEEARTRISENIIDADWERQMAEEREKYSQLCVDYVEEQQRKWKLRKDQGA